MVFYVIDGMDGVGKDTVADELVQKLESRGRRVLCFKHPNRDNVFGRLATESLHKEGPVNTIVRSLSYFMQLLVSSIRKSGTDADDYVFVRYYMSAVYLPKPMSKYLFRIASTILPRPDVGILVDAPAEVAMARIDSRGGELEIYENTRKLMAVRSDMRFMADEMSWHVLDNRGCLSDTSSKLDTLIPYQ